MYIPQQPLLPTSQLSMNREPVLLCPCRSYGEDGQICSVRKQSVLDIEDTVPVKWYMFGTYISILEVSKIYNPFEFSIYIML